MVNQIENRQVCECCLHDTAVLLLCLLAAGLKLFVQSSAQPILQARCNTAAALTVFVVQQNTPASQQPTVFYQRADGALPFVTMAWNTQESPLDYNMRRASVRKLVYTISNVL